jgi:hypothetical protein
MTAHQKIRDDYQLALNKIEELKSKCNKLTHRLEEIQIGEAEADIAFNTKIQDQANLITALKNELNAATEKSVALSQSSDSKGIINIPVL